MPVETTILVPVRYPLTESSIRTLVYAADLASKHNDSECIVLHVNLFQAGDRTQRQEIVNAIEPIIEDHDPAITVCTGLILEEAIAEEVFQTGADIIVVGENQQSLWQRILSRILGTDHSLPAYLRKRTPATVEVVG